MNDNSHYQKILKCTQYYTSHVRIIKRPPQPKVTQLDSIG